MNFGSDNTAGVNDEIFRAIASANFSSVHSYGEDALTYRLEARFSEFFERESTVLLVPTGTMANALAVAHIAPPGSSAVCHVASHLNVDEAGAPEFFGGGLKLIGVEGDSGKIALTGIEKTLSRSYNHPHQLTPKCLSISQATEFGTVYKVEEIAALAKLAHRSGVRIHMDGARLGNALATLGVTPAEATWMAGVDVLSFGATKGGALAAEAVVFFSPSDASGARARLKRSGGLLSKYRFIAAQFDAYLNQDLWLKLALHANRMAERLGQGLSDEGFRPLWPVESNMVFVCLPDNIDAKLQEAGAVYYRWHIDDGAKSVSVSDKKYYRFVTSHATSMKEVDELLSRVAIAKRS
jgi:threonine aldolase